MHEDKFHSKVAICVFCLINYEHGLLTFDKQKVSESIFFYLQPNNAKCFSKMFCLQIAPVLSLHKCQLAFIFVIEFTDIQTKCPNAF